MFPKDRPIKVVVADGHVLTRRGIAALVEDQSDMHLVADTGEEGELLRLVQDLRANLIVLDLNLSGGWDGLGICWRLKALPRPPHILVHTSYNFTDDVSSCLLAGADGYLHKSACCEEFLATVRQTVAGERVWHLQDGRCHADAASTSVCLTPKEREILLLMLRGYSNAEMTKKLYLGLPTVRTHVRNVLRKLGAKSRKEILRPLILEA